MPFSWEGRQLCSGLRCSVLPPERGVFEHARQEGIDRIGVIDGNLPLSWNILFPGRLSNEAY